MQVKDQFEVTESWRDKDGLERNGMGETASQMGM